MAIKAYKINSNLAEYIDEEFSAIENLIATEGVFDVTTTDQDFEVTESTPNAMTVDVNTGAALVAYTKDAVSWKVVAASNAVEVASISANTSGSNRVDAIVVHLTQAEPNELKNNVAEVLVVLGTGVAALSDGEVNGIVGDANWYRLADVTVPNGASTITNSDIADTRVRVALNALPSDGSSIYVTLVGNQSIDGIKSFTSFPVTPSAAPTSDYQAANKKYVDDSIVLAGSFGGNGSDGSFAETTGNTDIDLGSAEYFELNYTSFSLTGDADITFSNPHANGTIVVIKSQGIVTITSSATPAIDLRGVGGAGGAGGAGGGNNSGVAGNAGVAIIDDTGQHYGVQGNVNGAAGAGGNDLDWQNFYLDEFYKLARRSVYVACGSGGGGGSSGYSQSSIVCGAGGAGGDGAGALLIECAGALNFAGTIDISGTDGGDTLDVTTGTFGSASGGGGGGGSAGMCVILYNSLTANTGTVTATGGAGGDSGDATNSGGGSGTGSGGEGGGGGGSKGGDGGAGGAHTANGSNAGGVGAGGGGAGGVISTNPSGATATGKTGGTAGATDTTAGNEFINTVFF